MALAGPEHALVACPPRQQLPVLHELLQEGPVVAVILRPPADAHHWVRERVHWRTVARGGHGAAREVCDLLLGAQGHAEAALAGAL